MKLATLFSIMTVAGIGAAQQDSVAQVIHQPIQKVKEIATQYEMRTLQSAVLCEVIANNADVVQRDFPGFVRSIAHSDAKDVAKDLWGNSYELYKVDQGYEIVSAGADEEMGTNDDIVATVKFR